jgi:hypothetical protein
MNEKPTQQLAGASGNGSGNSIPGGSSDSPETSAVSFSKKRSFIIYVEQKNGGAPVTSDPATGKRQYLFSIRAVHGRDLCVCSKDLQLKASYIKPDATNPVSRPLALNRQDDGSYLTTITVKKGGGYELHLSLIEGELNDDHVALLTIK